MARKTTSAVQTLFKNFQTFNVLSDGDSFSSANNSQIMVFPNEEYCTDEQHDDLENGIIPETGDLATISLNTLLNEAMEARLDCVKPLMDLIGKRA
jgi:hypothetical protein